MNKKSILSLIFIFFIFFSSYPQSDSPYEMSWEVDGPWIGIGLGFNVWGFRLIQSKEPISPEELNALSEQDIPRIDRWAAGYYSERADHISYFPFYGSFAMPFVMMLTNKQRPHAGQLSLLFLETMATTGAMYTMTAGAVNRNRPLVYNTEIPLDIRSESGARRSFFAGHTAATAAATFFVAKVFHDFNPDSPLRPYIWGAAALVPAWVGYLRLEGGKHFLTDNILGYSLGALTGILVPELHKKEREISVSPAFGLDYQGLSLQYDF